MRGHITYAIRAVALLVLVALLGVPTTATGATSKTARLQAELEDIRADLMKAGREYDKAYWELNEADVRLDAVNADIGETEQQLAHARGLLSQRIDMMYRADAADYLAVLLGSLTFEEMVTRLDFFQRIGQADANAIEAVENLQTQLNEQRVQLEEETAARADALEGLKENRDALQRRLKSKQAEYEKVKAQLAGTSSASTRRVAAAPGANGMVFPVQGVNYYSDTWGASRSGGRRRHQGTDIMAPRGTPCVAVLSGTVSSKSGGLGGKTIWLHADTGWTFFYAHLDSYAVTGGRVRAGQVIGYVGSTGNAAGGSPHLHFEIHPGGGGAVNPYPYLRAMQ